jgi:hypothetical protein
VVTAELLVDAAELAEESELDDVAESVEVGVEVSDVGDGNGSREESREGSRPPSLLEEEAELLSLDD